MQSSTRLSLLLGFSLLVTQGCVTESTVQAPCPTGYQYDPLRGVCARIGADTGGSTDTGNAQAEDTFQPTPEDTGGFTDLGPEDTGPRVSEDVAAIDVKIDGQCNPIEDPMNLKVGMPCTDHAQCSTCYCYDEAYLSPFRFCTKDCSSGAGSACDDESNDPNEYTCLKFTAKHVNDYELTHGGVCMPTCQSDAECAIYAPDYVCSTNSSGTQWDGSTVTVLKTCIVP